MENSSQKRLAKATPNLVREELIIETDQYVGKYGVWLILQDKIA